MKRNATMKTFDIAKTLKTLTTLKSVDTVRAEQLAAALAKPADQRTWGDRMKIQADEFERFKAERAAAQSAFAAEPTPPSPVQYMPQSATAAAPLTRQTQVKKYTSAGEYTKDAKKMARQGWTVLAQSTGQRSGLASHRFLVFSRKDQYIVTYERMQ